MSEQIRSRRGRPSPVGGAQGAQTRIHHVCSRCAAVLGSSLTPWTGESVLTTHGVCRWCFVEMRLRDHLALSALDAGTARAAAGWSDGRLVAQRG